MGAGHSFVLDIDSLKKEPIPLENPQWESIWMIPNSFDEVFDKMPAEDLYSILKAQPSNFASMLKRVAIMLESHLSADEFSTASFGEVASGVRVIARLLPIAFQDLGDPFVEEMFWKDFVYEEEEEIQEAAKDSEQGTETKERYQPKSNLAHKIMWSLAALLFYPEYSISVYGSPEDDEFEKELPLVFSWAPGVKISSVQRTNSKMDRRRTELLKCIIAACSQSIYFPPDKQPKRNKWLDYLTSKSYFTRTLFYSLLNVSLSYDPVGWGVPYNHMMFSDRKENLSDAALQLLLVFLNYTPNREVSDQQDSINGFTTTSPNEPLNPTNNIFINLLREINDPKDFKFILGSFKKLLGNPLMATSTYLPNSTKSVNNYQEVLILLWYFVQENKDFLNYIITQDEINDIVISILYLLNQGRKEEANSGFGHLCTFLLLSFSGERQFGISLNKPFSYIKTEGVNMFTGTTIDYLVMIFKNVIFSGHTALTPTHECLLTTLSNISPYIKTLSMEACDCLFKIFTKVSSARYIFANPRNNRHVFFVLETFNNIIQYQYEGNTNLIYNIIHHRESFSQLANLQLPKPAETSEDQGTESKWVPTQEWYNSWKPVLPTNTVLRLIGAIIPQIPKICNGSAKDSRLITQYLKNTTMVGLLPVPHPILVRKYQPNAATISWLTSFMWGTLYVRNVDPPLFYGTKVELFAIM